MFTRHDLPLDAPFLPGLARRLLDLCGDRLPRARVVLPSIRACGSLRHALLEASGREGLLLPATDTPSTLVSDLARRLGIPPADAVPHDLRAVVLEPALARVDWLRDHPDAAAGLSTELVRIFDELRRHGLDPAAPPDGGFSELEFRDAARICEAWALYRERVPRDAVDLEGEITAAVETATAWPGAPIGDLVVAGFSDLTPLAVRLLRAVGRDAEHAHLVTAAAGDHPLTRLFLAAFSDADAPTHPLRPGRMTAARLLGAEPEGGGRDTRPYRERIADLDAEAVLVPDGVPRLLPCADSEQESRTVADLVIRRLREDPDSRIAVATADRILARRVTDQLVDAGLDLDVTDGAPLSAHADGRLLHALLRTVQTDGRADALLELLTHPLVDFGRERGDHHGRVLSFEKSVLRGKMSGAGLAELRQRAERHDAAIACARPHSEPKTTALMDDLESTLAAPLALARKPAAALAAHLDALREAWNRAAPSDPLPPPGTPEDASAPPARRALLRMLDDLAAVDDRLPPQTPGEIAALLTRRLGETLWWPNRKPHLPVLVTGLLEARLESYDLLVVAGLNEDVFPDTPTRRTLLLGRDRRMRHGLPDWRWDLGLDAELFLRLLHNGRRTVLTWSRERDGRPALPSTLVGRLQLATAETPAAPATPVLWRRDAATAPVPPTGDEARIVHAASRPLERFSYSALAVYRACPYRFLLEQGYGLSEPEPILEALRSKDYGQRAHGAMQLFLDPDGPGVRALAADDHDGTREALRAAARDAFADLAAPAQRRLWRAAFLAGEETLVDTELARARTGRAIGRECPFEFTLGDLHAWLRGAGADAPAPDPAQVAIVCGGRLDRVDLDHDGATVHVIDYKTGTIPTAKAVHEGEDLQLAVYALAVRLGQVPGAPPDATLDGLYYGLPSQPAGCDPAKPALTTEHDLVRDGALILETALAMADHTREFPIIPADTDPDDAKAPCRYCPWRGACRVDERPTAAEEAAS